MSREQRQGTRGIWLRWAIALSALAAFGACSSDASGNDDDAAVQQDAAVGQDVATESDATFQQDAATGQDAAPGADAETCPAPPPPGPPGMNAGLSCQNCHNEFTVAGTVYDSITGDNPVPSATVRITDANNQVLELVTGLTGNFFTTQSLNFPVSIEIEKCPDTASMPVPADTGACNSCHGNGNRIHLP